MFFLNTALLSLGIIEPALGALLITLDSHFHFTADEARLKTESPDWIIARYFFNMDAFGVFIHRAVAVLLFVITFVWLYSVLYQKKNFIIDYYPIFSKIVLSIILLGIIIKEIVLGQSGAVAFTSGAVL